MALENLTSLFFPVDMLRMFLSWLPKKIPVAKMGVYNEDNKSACGGEIGRGAVVRRVVATNRLRKMQDETQKWRLYLIASTWCLLAMIA